MVELPCKWKKERRLEFERRLAMIESGKLEPTHPGYDKDWGHYKCCSICTCALSDCYDWHAADCPMKGKDEKLKPAKEMRWTITD